MNQFTFLTIISTILIFKFSPKALLLFQLLFFRDIGAPGLPHALPTTEGVAEVGAVLLACVRRWRGDGVEAD